MDTPYLLTLKSTKIIWGIIQTLFDHIVQKHFSKPSIWPQQRSFGKISLKYVEPTVVKKLDFFVCAASPRWNFWVSFTLFILIYDIHNKILKLDCLGHFYFWPLLASFRGHWKTFLLKLIQQWIVGHFKGLMKGIQSAWNEFKIPTS